MKTIVLLGAGKSAHVLIQYLINLVETNPWKLIIGDISLDAVHQKIEGHPACSSFLLNLQNPDSYTSPIQQADIVISMLPAALHPQIARLCLSYKKHLITPSYISEEMQSMHEDAQSKNLIFLNEVGLDPGIDHMSAMKIIHHLHQNHCNIKSFVSYCGGLIAPESDNNPWKYKFTWNPRNVVVAGQGKGGIQYLKNNHFKYIPYYNLFKHFKSIEIDGVGKFEGYPNRDSLKYQSKYGLEDAETLIRGTLRKNGFCEAWDILIQLGLTEDSYELGLTKENTHADFIQCFLVQYTENHQKDIEATIKSSITKESFVKLDWLGLFDENKKLTHIGSPAKILQSILEPKLILEKGDKDMVVMYHEVIYTDAENKTHRLESSLNLHGKDEEITAMALTVGLPIGIACKMILNNQISETGVLMPTEEAIYAPILEELTQHGIEFIEKNSSVQY